jgi:hypothetical protein
MPMMALIPVASVTVIGMMGVFARQNRKEGWVKTRKTLIDALRQARRDLLTIPEAAATSSAVAYAGLPIDPTEFSSQLNRLQGSLERANQPVVTNAPVAAHVSAHVSAKDKVIA